ncbi:MAG TPA: ATP-binding protein [bacterium]|nr:ATP-binding protein [bacterium]
MVKEQIGKNSRNYMELAVEIMKKSVPEPRDDKTCPLVGAVLIKPDGVVETSHRGELRHGDHAEYTLLERKNREIVLDDSYLFVTLEPCAPGARKSPKLSCSERIVNARIKKVFVGIEDPDPTVDRKGIKYLLDNGIEVEMFDSDLQEEICEANKEFIQEAKDRAKRAKEELKEASLSKKEAAEPKALMDDLSTEHIELFIEKAKLNVKIGASKFNRIFTQLGLLQKKRDKYVPTGLGLLLFGERPQLVYPNAMIRATHKTKGHGEDIETVEGPLIVQAEKIYNWYKDRIGKRIDRSAVERKVAYDYPLEVFREAIINAIVHRDYDIAGAPIYFEINDDAIIIKSPGSPVAPLKMDQIKQFNAPSLSRNPKIMYVFDQLNLVEQRGLGFKTIKELPEKYGLPLPIVSYESPYIVFSFPRSSDAIRKISSISELSELNDEELKGYDWIKLAGEVSARDYANHFEYDYKKAQRHLRKMRDLGIIADNGAPMNSPNYKYKIINKD